MSAVRSRKRARRTLLAFVAPTTGSRSARGNPSDTELEALAVQAGVVSGQLERLTLMREHQAVFEELARLDPRLARTLATLTCVMLESLR